MPIHNRANNPAYCTHTKDAFDLLCLVLAASGPFPSILGLRISYGLPLEVIRTVCSTAFKRDDVILHPAFTSSPSASCCRARMLPLKFCLNRLTAMSARIGFECLRHS
jgi:hypothetical protein